MGSVIVEKEKKVLTMTEYIEREALIRRIKEIHCAECDSYHGVRCRACWVDDTLDYIDSEPAADVAEVVFARWEEADWREYDAQSCETIRYPKAAIVCTNCRCAFKKDALWKRNFCPSCGAKMDLE